MTRDLDMPPRIAALPRDSRGFPVPYIVLIDHEGKPTFTVNDVLKVTAAIRESLCHICSQPLEGDVWFTGGPGSALLNGDAALYHDGPMHHECMTFALRVCPYLTQQMTRYIAPVVSKQLQKQGIATFDMTGTLDGTPDLFVSVSPYRFDVVRRPPDQTFAARKPFRKVEYWQGGVMISRDEGERLARKAARKLTARLRQ